VKIEEVTGTLERGHRELLFHEDGLNACEATLEVEQ
jgi:hypothetical protein